MLRITVIFFAFILSFLAKGWGQLSSDSVQWNLFASDFLQISSIRSHPDGSLWMVESGRNRLLRLNAEGQRTDSLGKLGFSNYAFNEPTQVEITTGMKIFVLDSGNERVQLFDRRFQFLSSVNALVESSIQKSIQPSAIAVDVLARLYVYDQNGKAVFRFKPNGQFETSLAVPDVIHALKNPVLLGGDEKLWITGKGEKFVFEVSSNFLQLGLIQRTSPIKDISGFEKEIFVLTDREITVMSEQGSITKELAHPLAENAVSVAANGKWVFISTKSAVYRTPR